MYLLTLMAAALSPGQKDPCRSWDTRARAYTHTHTEHSHQCSIKILPTTRTHSWMCKEAQQDRGVPTSFSLCTREGSPLPGAMGNCFISPNAQTVGHRDVL